MNIQERNYEQQELDFRTIKQRYIRNNAITEQGSTEFVSQENEAVLEVVWKRYGKYVEIEYEVKAIQWQVMPRGSHGSYVS